MTKYFYTCCYLDCPRRRIDASKTYYYLEANGWEPARNISDANLVVIFTCGGFDFTESRSVKTIQKALSSKKKKGKVVVTGCLLKINPDSFTHLAEAEVIPDNELHKLDTLIHASKLYDEFPDANCIPGIMGLEDFSIFRRWAGRFNFNVNFIKTLTTAFQKKLKKKRHTASPFFRDLFNIKISQGCLGNCTYCALKIAHGKLQSKHPDRIIEEFRKGLDMGFKLFLFVTQDMGCYGLDIGTDIFTLLKSAFEEKGDFQLIITDFNVHWLIKDQKLLDLLTTHRDRIEEIRIPIQSGSDKILKLMKRPYTKEEAYNVLTQIREKMPGVKVNTHFIVGFPGETHENFLETARLIDNFDFHNIDIFCYQDRPGVESVALPNKISTKIKVKRAQELGTKGHHINIIY